MTFSTLCVFPCRIVQTKVFSTCCEVSSMSYRPTPGRVTQTPSTCCFSTSCLCCLPQVKRSSFTTSTKVTHMSKFFLFIWLRSGGHAVERRTVNRGDGGSIPPTTVSKLGQFRSPHVACVFRKRH